MEIHSRAEFLNIAGLFQGGIVVAALGLSWLAGVRPLETLDANVRDLAFAALAVVPMLLAYAVVPELRKLVRELIGRPLSLCRWYDLLLLAGLAGLGEELLFRGVLQPWIGRIHPLAGLIGANVLFGLAHAITPAYALLATAFGFYLSWLYDPSWFTGGEPRPNLLRPIVTHAVYDFVALLLIVREYRREALRDAGPQNDDCTPRAGE